MAHLSHHKLDMNQTYTSVQDLIYKLAHRMAARHDLTFDEALSECNAEFVKLFHRYYDDRKGMKFSTRLYMGISHRSLNIGMKRAKKPEQWVELKEEHHQFAPEQRSICLEAIGDLSHDAQTVVKLLIDSPLELADISTPKGLLRKTVQFMQRQGHAKERIDAACQELRTAFGQIWQTAS